MDTLNLGDVFQVLID